MSKDMLEIRIHGRAGQGAWTASRILAQAALLEGKHIQSFPNFGPERQGAPMVAFARLSMKEIRIHADIVSPDIVAVLDPSLLDTQPILAGVQDEGVLVINTSKSPTEIRKRLNLEKARINIFCVPASNIAIQKLGRDITNTAIIGAIIKATGIIKLESLYKVITGILAGKKVEENLEVIKLAYQETVNQ